MTNCQFLGLAPQFVVTDVRAAAEYYRDKFGFEILGYFFSEPPVYAIVRRLSAIVIQTENVPICVRVIWAFVGFSFVWRTTKPLVRALVPLTYDSRCRKYYGDRHHAVMHRPTLPAAGQSGHGAVS